jgi:SSS family solute:Na+ symporter
MSTTLAAITLDPLDGVVVALFVAAILALGFSARLRDSSILQFLVAGRRLTLPFFVATLVSTWYGGILGVGESVTYFGLGTWLLLGVPYYVFALVYALWLAPRVRGAEQISLPERLAMRWGKAAGLISASLVFLLAVPAAHVLMLGVLVRELTNWPMTISVVAGAVVGTLFLYKGGLLADVRVGMLAFLMMYVGFAIIVVWCLLHHPPAATFATIQNKSLLTFTGGSGWPVILSFFILGAWTLVDPGFHQRVASAASPDVGRTGVLVSIGFWFLFDVLTTTTGLYALALLKPIPADPLALFPELGNQILPSGLKAVFFCGMLGTITSAMVGYTLVSGATVGREVVGRLITLDEEQTKLWTRVGFGIACLVAVLLALEIKSVVDLWYAWGGCVVGALLIPVIAAYRRRATIRPSVVVASMALSFGASFVWLVQSQRTNNSLQEVAWIRTGGAWHFALPPIPEGLPAADVIKFGIGTLLPGLVISALVTGIGELAGRRIRKE